MNSEYQTPPPIQTLISRWIVIIIAGIKDNYKSFNEFDFRPHMTSNYS